MEPFLHGNDNDDDENINLHPIPNYHQASKGSRGIRKRTGGPTKHRIPVRKISTRARERAGRPSGMAKTYRRKAEKHRK
ncbi:hypothetical protein HanRHA438_Chr01g0020361 [Helianthus annuus]|uniref:Uncharacterized protein n=1 Tax=Helianthus annuus TaxID=4232 RepID=A0A251VNC1_HELAN|nr:hypothetical protein HanXRQr2_Chr01g0019781 [Helianthus annuus]KAJ0611466.1 hypothetical protein HanHA300_Chr01g0016141 [Helianthus annuus]KAJ0622518.1 hypothetical protein HanIR_Chr01g0021601 [Helianthus annuus]KAJ0626765.1 hypothetical protein HanHA89_Chr01g0017761 [Helianthus annuus]KAJ0783112.1 hypothetical protein HanLR1_Chr01g0016691 [Helianthus annuus]